MDIVLFCNDSYFAYLLAEPIFYTFCKSIKAVVFSTKIKSSLPTIFKIYRQTYPRYFLYRATVDACNKMARLTGGNGISSLVRKNGLVSFNEGDINVSDTLSQFFPADLGVAINFDQKIGDSVLKSFKYGILNCHASKLPKDKGISPALWAFARGDDSIWFTIYKMTTGFDAGPIYKQVKVGIDRADTAFSIYERVCAQAGEELVKAIEDLRDGTAIFRPQSLDIRPNYFGWPDARHKTMMRASGRKFIKFSEILRALGPCKPRVPLSDLETMLDDGSRNRHLTSVR
ncbi:formyltransferase family protein [Desulfomonile tiedjei]|uniref:Methionyl-tRNA formyltransferase n=1 Tax=Desulfomonile tiedjei (strain ATCC 49306 / DSM 6799 / DCB-1) TaxID=706587 RepID=I4BZN2_DESTA|nr:formyltransferase family protein [Desulfomonile tiedjei]AFM22773.1 methionyl-tRNA formyltransferase [Desulfomonile tiedjei DSM 6799]